MKKFKIIISFTPMLIVLLLIIGIIRFPNQSILAAKDGLNIWTSVLIPSLLPFIICANLIVDLKVVDIIGFLINPITKFLFNVSGKSALVFAISTVSGYPVGAKLASELRLNNQISKSEAQRLVSFCSTSGPLFIIGSVGTGMFQNPSIGYLMIICHYIASLSVGILFRKYGRESLSKSKDSLKSNIQKIIRDRCEDDNGFFVLFGNAVFHGVNTLLTVGGFVIIFSVVFKVLSLFNVISLLTTIIYLPLSLFGVSKELCYAFISGLFEMTIGCSNVSSITSSSEVLRASLSSFLIGFSGLSILAQCCTFLSKTDINTNIYILSKFLHGCFASIFTFLFYPISKSSTLIPTFNDAYNIFYNNYVWLCYTNNFKIILPIFILIYLITALYILNPINKNIIKK